MPRTSNVPPVAVALLVVPQTAPAVLYSLLEIFASVGVAWEELTGTPAGTVRMAPRVVAERTGLVRCAWETPIVCDASFATPIPYDVVLTSDLVFEPGFDPRGRWPAAGEWLRTQFDRGALIASVCTGSLLLAEAGLLDALVATSHWGAVPLFKRFYPRVQLEPDRVLAPAGPEHRIVTAGGAASWAELALYLIARFCGQEEAVRSSKVFLLGDRSDGQLPFAAMTRPRGHGDAVIERCQVWIASHYEVPNPVARMIEHGGLAPRTFKRRFRAATGYTPIEYVQTLRIEESKQLLEATDMPTDEIAAAVGYTDPASFRRIFKRRTGVTPAHYRRRFQAIGRLPRPAAVPSTGTSPGGKPWTAP